MTDLQFADEVLDRLQERYPRFHARSYIFVLQALTLAVVVAREAAIGLALGFALRALIAGAEFAGHLSGQQIGFSYGATIDPQSGVRNNMLATLYGMLATLGFLAINGHHAVLRALARPGRVVVVDAVCSGRPAGTVHRLDTSAGGAPLPGSTWVGAGWGGSAWALVRASDAGSFLDAWLAAYRQRYPRWPSEGFVSPPSAGAERRGLRARPPDGVARRVGEPADAAARPCVSAGGIDRSSGRRPRPPLPFDPGVIGPENGPGGHDERHQQQPAPH